MKKAACLALVAAGATVPVAGVGAESYGIMLSANIPVICVLRHTGTPGAMGDVNVSLGMLREFCNAPRGYDLVVSYTPGSLRGARIMAGTSQIVLDGSGESTVGNSPMPRNREIPLSATAGQNGFDTDRLEFRLVPKL